MYKYQLKKKVMKKVLYLLLASAMFFISCSKDDEPVLTHEIGTWELDSYILTNLPAGFTNNEGRIFAVNEINFGGVSFDSYEITFASDFTYQREISVTGPDLNDEGTWELDGDDLTLISDEFDDEEDYNIEENEDDQLWWSLEVQFGLLHDTTTQAYVDTLTPEELADLITPVSLDLVYAFERK